MRRADTHCVHAGRTPERFGGLVNTPIFRGSTVLAESFEAWQASKQAGNPYANYGRFGTPTTQSFEQAIAELEGGQYSLVFPSGLSACTHSLLAFLGCGDHVLITDNVYGPTRMFADRVLSRIGVTVEYFDPREGSLIAKRLRSNTRVVFLESPGSLTFEIADVPSIAAAAHAVDAMVIIDNTWASPLYFKAFEHGADVSIQAATKYIIGHSDALLGTATANFRAWPQLKASAHDFGETASPDDIFLALRGLRSMHVRMRQHWHAGLTLAASLESHPAIDRVLHPALSNDPSHELWKRDFTGASGLFGIRLASTDMQQIGTFINALKLFGIGLS